MSDAGTPGISDPGFYLAREAVKAGVTVQTLPGATACIPALVSSGLPCDRFCFEGFLPQKKGRQTHLEEPPQPAVAREVSKVHEEHVRGTLNEVIAHFEEVEPKGEIVIVLAGNAEANETVRKSSDKAKDKREKTNEELLHEMLYGKKKD